MIFNAGFGFIPYALCTAGRGWLWLLQLPGSPSYPAVAACTPAAFRFSSGLLEEALCVLETWRKRTLKPIFPQKEWFSVCIWNCKCFLFALCHVLPVNNTIIFPASQCSVGGDPRFYHSILLAYKWMISVLLQGRDIWVPEMPQGLFGRKTSKIAPQDPCFLVFIPLCILTPLHVGWAWWLTSSASDRVLLLWRLEMTTLLAGPWLWFMGDLETEEPSKPVYIPNPQIDK